MMRCTHPFGVPRFPGPGSPEGGALDPGIGVCPLKVQSTRGLQPDVYGPGIHQNQYGQPVTVKPDHGGVPGEQLRLKRDVYGPGVHMDQYGRPVREQPWP